jgi:ABC-type nickel/cobalt efflux system permease component RcnA
MSTPVALSPVFIGRGIVLGLITIGLWQGLPLAQGHPVPRKLHDRTIAVMLTASGIVVDYRLEVDEFTVVFVDVPAVLERAELARLSSPREFYDSFTRLYAPVLGDNLIARLDGRPLAFQCIQRVQRQKDEEGRPLDHLRFDFRFRAAWEPGKGPHDFDFREGNYELEDGLIRLSLVAERPTQLLASSQPDRPLQERRPADLGPGDAERLRRAKATFLVGDAAPTVSIDYGDSTAAGEIGLRSSLLGLLLDPGRGLWVLLLVAAGFGAVHALTPGHGKTLVAAYLVGERGTVWHATVLGLVTTLTHTGAVLALAGVLLVLYPDTVPARIREALGVGGGLLVAGLGLWLLMRRLSGGADHVHLAGAGHHHHHVRAAEPGGGWWGLVVLGISGGIVPCWDAIAMFGFAVSAQRVWLALPLLLAFSAGLAGVLIIIGVLVVRVKGYAGSRWGDGRLFRALPLASAVAVTLLGLWLCYDSIRRESGSTAGAPAGASRPVLAAAKEVRAVESS